MLEPAPFAGPAAAIIRVARTPEIRSGGADYMTASERLGPRGTAATAVSALLILGVAIPLGRKIGEAYGWDEGPYLASARAMTQGHPLFSSVFSSQPPVFLEMLAAAFRVFGDSAETGAWMSWLFAVACLAIVGWIARQVAGPIASPVAVLAMLSKIFLGQATAIEAEIPALALALLAVAMIAGPGGQAWRVAAAGGIFALAVLCKLWVVPYGIPLVFLAVVAPRRNGADSWQTSSDRGDALRRLIVLSLSGALVTVLVLYRCNLHEAYDQVVAMHLGARQSAAISWERSGAGLLVRFARDEFGVLGLALVGAGLLSKRNPLAGAWLLLWVFSCVVFLVNHSPVFIRHVLLVSPPVAVLAASAVGLVFRWPRPWQQSAAATVVAALMLARPTASLEAGAPLWRNLAAFRRSLRGGASLRASWISRAPAS